MKAISKSKIIEKNSGGGSSGSVTALATRVTTLENNERKVTYYTEINSASGTITVPTNATILLNQYPGGVDALVSTISSSQPTGNLPVTSAGVAVDVSSFDALGNYTLTGTPTSFPVALIYVFKIKDLYWSNVTLDPNILYDEAFKTEFLDSEFVLKDNLDTSKRAVFQASGLTTNTTRTFTLPDASGTVPLGTGANTRIATWSGTNTLSSDANFTWSGSALLVGGTSTADGGLLSVQKNQNAGTYATVINTTSGTGAFASLIASNLSGIGTNVSLSAVSAGYTTSGIFVAGAGVLNSSLTGGLNVGTSASTPLMFWTNNSERARFLSSGEFVVGNTTVGALSEYVGFTKNQNARTRVAAYNTTSGTAAAVQYDMRNNNGVQVSFGLHSSAFTTSGALIADGAFLYGDGSGGLVLTAAHASGSLGFYTAGTAAGNLRLTISSAGLFTIWDGGNLALGTTTGTKIGTATTQKIGFWNATPIVQPTTSVAAATLVGGGGTTLTDTDTFDGYTLKQIVKALRNTGILA